MKINIRQFRFGHVLYILAVLAFLYLIYVVYKSFGYINSLVQQGQVSYGHDFGQILEYLVNNCGMSGFYVISFSVYGYLCNRSGTAFGVHREAVMQQQDLHQAEQETDVIQEDGEIQQTKHNESVANEQEEL